MTTSKKKSATVERRLNVEQIETPFRVRHQVNKATVQEYAEDIKGGAKMPLVDVFVEEGSSRYILADGEHRVLAHMQADRKTIKCKVHTGTEKEALRFALQANATNGLRRTMADKRKCVLIALNEAEFDGLSLRELADLCHVSHEMVRQVKQEINEKTKELDDKDDDKTEEGEGSASPGKMSKGEHDLVEFRNGLDAVRQLPYDGGDMPEGFELTKQDLERIEFVVEKLVSFYEAATGEQFYETE